MTNSRHRRPRQTNPIPVWTGTGEAGDIASNTYRAKRTQLPEAGHRGGVGESAGRWNTQRCHYSIIPPSQSDANCAERSQFRRGRVEQGLGVEGRTCKTNPIPGGSRWDEARGRTGERAKQTQLPWREWNGQVLGEKGVMMSWTRKEPWQNKANSRNHADREIGVPGGGLCETKPIIGRMPMPRGHLGPTCDGVAGRATLPSPLRGSRLYWVATGN